MPFSEYAASQDGGEPLRLRLRAGLEAMAVLATSLAGLLLAASRPGVGFAGNMGFAVVGVLALVVAAMVYRGRVAAIRDAQLIEDQRQRLKTIVDHTGVAMWEALGQDQMYMSESWAQMLGIVRDASQPMSHAEWCALVHPDDLPVISRQIAESYARRDFVFQIDYRLRHVDGRWIWMLSRGTVVERSADGRPLRMVGTQTDITARKLAESQLEESERKFRSLFERSPVGIALTDYRTRRFLQVNDAFAEPGGYSRDELLGMSYDQLVVRKEPAAPAQKGMQREQLFRSKDGHSYPVLVSGIRMTDSTGRDVVWSVVQDISHRKAVEQELAEAARRDRLTGLANRTQFIDRLNEAVRRVKAGEQSMFAVLFLDFDRFKVVNDAMGHQAGDELLVQIASRLRGNLRAAGSSAAPVLRNQVARFGGDEFLVLVNDVTRREDAGRIADRLQQVLAKPYQVQGRELHSSASIGIVTSDHCLEGAETIIRNADVAMYEAKRAGRARSVFFSDEMHTRLTRNVLIETSLREALEKGQLSLMYQPIVELDTGKRSSVEALIRWNHPTMGAIPPSEFIPVAEECGLIVQIGEWVMRESCAALARWLKLDPDKAPRVVSVNVSRVELAQGTRLLQSVRHALEASGLPPQSLQLEVTEREVMRDPQASLALMQQLRETGVRLAMDDFGTGTSSLGCLRDYPFDVIKIDRSFVTGLNAGPDTLAVIHATITLVENLGKCSVAEGVENGEQLAILQSLGCHYAQGYFLGYPLVESEVVQTERTIVAPRLKLA